MTGRTYLERGSPVTVLLAAQRSRSSAGPPIYEEGEQVHPLAPYNVKIRRHDGSVVVRPLRGLRLVRGVRP